LILYYIFAKLWTICIKKYPICTLENVLSSTIKILQICYIFFANDYLISSLNRIENTAQHSINCQAGVLQYTTEQSSHVHSAYLKCPPSAAMQAQSLMSYSL